MKTMAEFQQFYDTELRPVLEGFEARRKKICWTLVIVTVAALAVVGLLFAVGLQAAVLGGIVAVGIVVLTYWLLTRGFVPEFKREVIARVVEFCDPGLSYSPQRHITEQQFRQSRIFEHRIDRFQGEDHVSGRIGQTDIEFSEIHAQYKTTTTDSKGRRRTHWHTIFKGLFFIGDFNKHFRTSTIVLPDVAERFLGFLGTMLQEWNFTQSGSLVKLEDPEFEQEFAVYGEDQVEARYVLSPSLMRRIVDFKRKTGNQICLSFVASNIYLGMSTDRNLFEPRIFQTLLDFNLVRQYLEDLELAVGIVEDLNLNTRIWTKE
jgi:hypothetical protein